MTATASDRIVACLETVADTFRKREHVFDQRRFNQVLIALDDLRRDPRTRRPGSQHSTITIAMTCATLRKMFGRRVTARSYPQYARRAREAEAKYIEASEMSIEIDKMIESAVKPVADARNGNGHAAPS